MYFQYAVDERKVVGVVSFQRVRTEVETLVVDHIAKDVGLAWKGHMVDANHNVDLDDAVDVEEIETQLDPVALVVKMYLLILESILVAVCSPFDTSHW